ncbi:MAG: carboxymuconolactone decarboxylase family protein [Elusimicrobia bacterium]|nr:carboxymuconolactone decarboxylase family protein [Elusimicrobiota bacterium]
MKPIHHTLLPLLLGAFAVVPAFGAVDRAAESERAEETYRDIQTELGMVPSFFRMFPQSAVPGAWAHMKSLQLGRSTALDGRIKELIGLAAASQIPCRYCAYFHESAAKANGATDEEIRETVAVSALTREWSTLLAGNQIEESAFRRDVDRLVRNAGRTARATTGREADMREAPAGQGTATGRVPAEGGINGVVAGRATVEDVRRDVERHAGFFPSFMRSVPDAALPGLWLETRQLMLNPDTRLTAKEKDLIGLGTAAAVPDRYGIYARTKSALHHGASEAEVREAVAIAAMTRHWSSFLNGLRVDEKQFQRDTDEALDRMQRQRGGK